MNRFLIRCLLLVVVAVSSTTTTRAAFVPSRPVHSSLISNSNSNKVQTRNVQLALVDVSTADIIFPSLLFLVGMAGTILYSDESVKAKFEEKLTDFIEADFGLPSDSDNDDETTTTTTTTTQTTTTVSTATKVVEEPDDDPEEEEIIVTTITTKSTGNPSKSISDLRKEVASTVEDVRATQARIQQRSAATSPPPEPESEPEPVVTNNTEPKKRGILQKSWRVLKKVVAPWRKWENIS